MALISTEGLNKYQSILSTIDGILTALERMPEGIDLKIESSINPFELLLEILKRCHVTEDDIIEWLANFIKYFLPVIELGVKGILLSNMKAMISCSVDPRIPKKYRDEGFYFDLGQIDPNGYLSNSPLDFDNNQMYFGIDSGMTSPYELLRPMDFDAFLWFVIHFGKYPNASKITGYTKSDYNNFFSTNYYGNVVAKEYTEPAENIFDVTEISINDIEHGGIILGNSFRQENMNCVSVCTVVDRDEDGNISYNKIMPVSSSDWDRTNYYVNRKTYFNFIDPTGTLDKTNPRKYNSDVAICNFKYLGYADKTETVGVQDFKYLSHKLNIKILPKPFVHIPRLGQSTLLPTILRFNNHGQPDISGRFTIKCKGECHVPYSPSEVKKMAELILSLDLDEAKEAYAEFKEDNKNPVWYYDVESSDGNTYYVAFSKSNQYKVTKNITNNFDNIVALSPEETYPILYECYPHLTIYEFNYDYIMSMRLFDAKVVATQLINALLSVRFGMMFGMNISTNEIAGSDRIINIVQKIVESDDYESSDCFFSFSNEEYDRMSMESELKRAQMMPFGEGSITTDVNRKEIIDLINNFGDAATLEESIDSFKKLVNQTTGYILNPGTDPYDKTSVEWSASFDIITQFIKQLMNVIVQSLLSPKVLLMIMMNTELCGQDALYNLKNMSIEKVLQQMSGLITSIVKEIRDLILKQLLEFVMSKLSLILAQFAIKLTLEQAEDFRRIMKRLLEECLFSFTRGDLVSTIDSVYYADITEQSQPNKNKC